MTIRPFNSGNSSCKIRKLRVCKTYSGRMNGCRDSATEDRKTSRFRLCPKIKDCRWTTHFVQTIPSAVLRDIPGALSFATLLPKSPGQLLHPLRKVSQAFRFLKFSKYSVKSISIIFLSCPSYTIMFFSSSVNSLLNSFMV